MDLSFQEKSAWGLLAGILVVYFALTASGSAFQSAEFAEALGHTPRIPSSPAQTRFTVTPSTPGSPGSWKPPASGSPDCTHAAPRTPSRSAAPAKKNTGP